MAKILETERLVLRTWSMDDAEAAWPIYSNPEVMLFLGGPDQTLEDTQKRIQRALSHHERHGYGMWAVVEKASGQLIGACGLKHLEDGPLVEVGYHLARPVWGHGYAMEAAAACLCHGFEHLHMVRIVAVVAPASVASVRVIEKIGMTFEAMGRHYGREVRVYAAHRPALLKGIGRTWFHRSQHN
jgi:ribosomal-protein-alanine N-acetyltransferase